MQKKLAMLQHHLELDSDLTRFQPPQVSVLSNEDGAVRCVLLTTVELFYRHQAILASRCFGRGGIGGDPASLPIPCGMLSGSNFRISERYRCVADHRGQVQGGVGFIFEGVDMLDSSKVQQSCCWCRFPSLTCAFHACWREKECVSVFPLRWLMADANAYYLNCRAAYLDFVER